MSPCPTLIGRCLHRAQFREFSTYEEIRDSFLSGDLSADDLKRALVDFLNELLIKVGVFDEISSISLRKLCSIQVQEHCNTDVVREALEKGYQEVEENRLDASEAQRKVDLTEQQLKTLKGIIDLDKVQTFLPVFHRFSTTDT